MEAELRGRITPVSLQTPNNILSNSQSSLTGALRGCLGSLDGACIEKLLLHCSSALESNDVTLAQQVMWVLNNVASATGDPNQRLASWFLRALVSRVSRLYPTAVPFNGNNVPWSRLMSVTELAGYVDLIPWHRFGFCASNSAILKAIKGRSRVHIIDLSITHCMQWPTLIDLLGKRQEGPPSLRISVPSWRSPVPPFLNMSIEEVGLRLVNFAKSRNFLLEFNLIGDSSSSILTNFNPSTLDLRDDEALVINFQSWIRYLPEDQRSSFLQLIKGLSPQIVVIADEDLDLDVSSLSSRISACFNYLWIPFDALETFLPKESTQRQEYESDIGRKIDNIIGFEGIQRVERLESGINLSQKMKTSGFLSYPFDEETIGKVKVLLDEHASGWGMKKEDDMLVLIWKGHNAVYATAWVPSSYQDLVG